ncbi:MAG: response regulator [Proteobacteria bacterium]|nr:response regulator [Pseudomonadota bacterium]
MDAPQPRWLDRWFHPPTASDLETSRRLAMLHPTAFTLAVAAFLAVLVSQGAPSAVAYAVFAVLAGIAFALAQGGYSRIGSLCAAIAPLTVPYAGFMHWVDGQSVLESMWLALAVTVGVLLLPWRWAMAWTAGLPLFSFGMMIQAGIPVDTSARVCGVLLVIGVSTTVASAALAHRDRLVGAQLAREAESHEALQKALAEAQTAVETKDRFLAVLTHELRTPLTGVLGGSRLLLEAPLTPEQRRTTEVIQRSGSSLLTLIDDLLDVSRLRAGTASVESTEVDVINAIKDQLTALQTSGRAYVPLLYVGPATVPPILADPRRLNQVLGNLLTNAAKFTRDGHIAIDVVVRGQRVGLQVKDTGPGIRGADRQRVFQAFEQVDTRRGGAGLGLSIARGLMQAMGGSLELEDTDHGTCFTAWLPAAGVDERGSTPMHGQAALIVHPVEALCSAMIHWMEGWGYHVIAATTIEQAERWLSDRDFDALVVSEGVSLATLPRIPPHRVWIGRSRPTPPGDAAIDSIVLPGDLLTALTGDVLVDPDSGTTATPPPVRLRARVLLAEDNPVNRMVLRGMLGTLGCEVQVAEDGLQAVDAVARNRFDLVLMDCQMPEMDGFEATRTILARETVPIVALTASASDDVRDRCTDAGMCAFLTKPVSLETLSQEISRQLK